MEEKGQIFMDGYAVKDDALYLTRHPLKRCRDDTDAKKIKDFIDAHDFYCILLENGKTEVTVTPKSF